MLPKLIITDIDGVWTDGSMYYDQTGNELKRFNTYDSAGVLFAHLLDIPVVIITGEDTEIVARRAKKIKVDYLFQGVKNKVKVIETLLDTLQITFEDCAFIGDDINDIALLQKVGFSGCPSNAPEYVKNKVHYTTTIKGGDGAFREFVEHILKQNNVLETVLEKAIQNHEKSN
ncbi:3-deoxy-D-manno-octulosonate 8-phosphate phosphatase [Flavobacterium cauense R2A-7]|uniref:3-deoxy-D-manno-octulosonate 8-phosphate phosphatase (KDO 8-P phosphatase) n=1 Tax=Flavobacterium cauense R2A-7 TaxID=1341154 RepID=V6S2A2_9FLAO|nr:HAD hydrolase family protein [Flavobacterium cauense]ESU20826.1 3-deoxy-D-manno-octulosonate 8-phosphate phosphatase [Flavobacterium cauense R2A-7]KGO82807.1 acylneuraminate cytidylyltransferase [Flavobacterium cauense R2A-7]TWI12169.1 3-deoxy-D-manno-octulosonate 8-phosphate phosphatase (KDO 8-P phosphatase) [Flavobacterium cauense R2A-7]